MQLLSPKDSLSHGSFTSLLSNTEKPGRGHGKMALSTVGWSASIAMTAACTSAQFTTSVEIYSTLCYNTYMDKYNTIPKAEQGNVLSMFWSMLREQEEQAYESKNRLDRHMVESAYLVWNRATGDDLKPRWSK